MTYNKLTTIGEIENLAKKTMAESNVFKIGKKGIARCFLQLLLNLPPNVGNKEAEEKYRQSHPSEDIPEDSEEFWNFIALNYLNLTTDPREEFIDLSLKASEDLAEIASNLEYIYSERKSLEEQKRKNGRLTADERYYRNQLEYFEKKNISAQAEIVEFIAKDIKNQSEINARKQHKNPFPNLLGLIFKDSPYTFGRGLTWSHHKPYDVRSLDEYSNKFNDLPIPIYREEIKKCRESPEHFKELARVYINGTPGGLPSIREKIEKLVEKSHILARRKQVVTTMLNHFDSKDYISFVSIAPLQIEGIFADICREAGVSESQLDISSLNEKLQHIDENLKSFFFFEYYSFKFPVLRNLVAHGGLVDGELEGTAIHLILDLLPVCELAASKDLPINHALSILDAAITPDYKKLTEWIYLREQIVIPEFYDAQCKIEAATNLYDSPKFWEHLEGELKSLRTLENLKNSNPFKAAGILKRSKIATDKAEGFLKSAHKIVENQIKERDRLLEKIKKSIDMKKPSQ